MNKGVESAFSEREIKEAFQNDDDFFIQILVQDDASLNIPIPIDGQKQYLLEYAFYSRRPNIFSSLLRHGARFGLIEEQILQYIRNNRASRQFLKDIHKKLHESHTLTVLENTKKLVVLGHSFDEMAKQLLPVSTPRKPPRMDQTQLQDFVKFGEHDPDVANVVYDLCTSFMEGAPVHFDITSFRQTMIGLLPRSKPVALVRLLQGFFPHFDDTQRVRALIFIKELIVYDDYHLSFKDSEFQNTFSEFVKMATADGRADLIEMLKSLIEMRQALRIPFTQSLVKMDDVLNATAPDLIDIEKLLVGSAHQSAKHGRELAAEELASDLANMTQRFFARLRPGLLMWPDEEGESSDSFQCFRSVAHFHRCLQQISSLLSRPIMQIEKAGERMRVMKFYIETLRHLVKGQQPNLGAALFLDGVLDSILPNLAKGKLDEKWTRKRKELQKLLKDEHLDWMPSLDRYLESLQIIRNAYDQKKFHRLCFSEGQILLDFMSWRSTLSEIAPFRTTLFQFCSQPMQLMHRYSQLRDTLSFIPELKYDDLMTAMKIAIERKVLFHIIHKGETLHDRRKIFRPLYAWLENADNLSAQQKLDALLTLDKLDDKTSLEHSGKYGRQFKTACERYKALILQDKEKQEKEEKKSSSEETKSLTDSKKPLIATPERGMSSEDPIFAIDSEGEMRTPPRDNKKLLKKTRKNRTKMPERSHSTTSTLILEEHQVEVLVEKPRTLVFSRMPTHSPEMTPPSVRRTDSTPPIQRRDVPHPSHFRSQSSDSSDGKLRIMTKPSQ